jgi:hypothetical protein
MHSEPEPEPEPDVTKRQEQNYGKSGELKIFQKY